MITFELHGDPEGKARPRARIATKKDGTQFIAFYNTKETTAYENAIALAAKIKMGRTPLLTGPVFIRIIAFCRVPGSWSGKKRMNALAGLIYPTTKPDFDNIAKVVADALKEVVWNDDTQVVRAIIEKVYSERPRLSVTIEQMQEALFQGEVA